MTAYLLLAVYPLALPTAMVTAVCLLVWALAPAGEA